MAGTIATKILSEIQDIKTILIGDGKEIPGLCSRVASTEGEIKLIKSKNIWKALSFILNFVYTVFLLLIIIDKIKF